MPAIPLADVQGLILRSYGMDALRLFVLRVDHAPEARKAIGQLPVTSGSPWSEKPDACVNIAITHAGLTALDLPADTLASFPEEFRQGAAARAAIVGDTGDSASANWKGGLAGPGVHALVLVFARNADIRGAKSAALSALWKGAMTEVSLHDAGVLPGNVTHFGYRDGFSQPTIEGGLANPVPDILPAAPAGEFLLGHPSQFSKFTYPVPQPPELGMNGSFLALRILAQDCAAFDKLLQEAPQKFGVSGEKLAAKMAGRWRNGVPLEMSPETDNPDPPISLEQLNRYDYIDDPKGYRCPAGSHMRRNNPRNSPIAGGSGLNHRIVRRGLPYGPPFDAAHPDDGIERGLVGLFIGVSLKDQFEFLMSEWVNGSVFAAGLAGSKDPLLGDNSGGTGKFVIPVEGKKPIIVSGFSRLVTTRGGAYAFLPSLSALSFISNLR